MSYAAIGLVLSALSVIIPSGCSSSAGDYEPYHVSGTIQYDGKPVPSGRIDFFPDRSKGNQGTAGYAVIHNGVFDTKERGKPTVGGFHRLVITGLREDKQASNVPDTQLVDMSLFPRYESEADFESVDSDLNIVVPTSK
ncbi:hypothetical protein AB1K70_23355 [Bremerella sp. JC770]|uniref:hypothetical protein n=1 Tax=Bremerella sp. JC770 TaxID=3232137 RepID=UPI003457C61B